MKLVDLDEKVRAGVRSEIHVNSEVLGFDSYETANNIDPTKYLDKYGICPNCSHFQYLRYEYGNEMAQCYEYDVVLRGVQRVVECMAYSKRGAMTLNQMTKIAYILGENKTVKGFGK